MMCNEITFDKLPEAVAYLIEKVAELKSLVEDKKSSPLEKRIPIGIDDACRIICKAKPTIYTWDRYSRSLEYALTNIRQLKKLDIEVNSIVNPLDYNSSDFPTMLGIYVGSTESENNKISLRTKNGIHEKWEMYK